MLYARTAAVTAAAVLASLLCQAKDQTWIEVRTPNFIVASNAGEKQARKSAAQLEEIRSVFRQSLKVASSHPSPVITVLAVKDEGSMRELLPDYWAKGHAHPAGLFAGRFNQFCAAVQLDAQGTNPYATFYHEYYHTITVPYFPGLPVWLAEGLAEFYGHTEIEEKFVGMGQADPGLLQELRTNSLIPLETLFQVDHTSPYYNETNKTSIFYAESWALAHYLMLGDRGVHRPLFSAYLEALNQGKGQQQAAIAAFGDLKKLQADLQTYIGKASFLYMKIPMTTTIADDQMTVRPLSEAQVDAYRGEFAMARGHTEDATKILQAGLVLDSNVALLHEYLAMCDFLSGHREPALESVSKAIDLDPKNFFTRYLRAYLATSGRMMGGEPYIEDDLRQAIALNPEFAPSYSLLAVYLAARGQDLEEALTLAQKAVSLQPGDSNAQLSLAQALTRLDKFDEANLAVARASAWATDPAEKSNAENYKVFLQQKRRYESQLSSGSGDRLPSLKTRDSASPSDQQEHEGPVAPFAVSARMEMEISTIGGYSVDLKPYLQSVAEALRHKLAAHLDITLRQTRTVGIEFSVSSDGTPGAMKVASTSGDTKIDQAALDGLAASSPLPAPPKELKSHAVRLSLQVSYISASSEDR